MHTGGCALAGALRGPAPAEPAAAAPAVQRTRAAKAKPSGVRSGEYVVRIDTEAVELAADMAGPRDVGAWLSALIRGEHARRQREAERQRRIRDRRRGKAS